MTGTPEATSTGQSTPRTRPVFRAQVTTYVFVIVLVLALAVGLFFILFQTAADTPGELTITELEPGNATVDENDTVTVSVTIENTGGAGTTEIVSLSLANEETRVSLTLEPGEAETLELPEVQASTLGFGETTYEATTEEHERIGTLTVVSDRPPLFEVRNLQPGNFSLGDTDRVDISAEIVNTGGMAGNQTVTLRLENDTITEVPVELGPEESETFDVFNVGFGALEAGERTYEVFTANDSATGVVDVPESATFELTALEPGDVTVQQDEQFTVSVTVENTGELGANRSVEFRVDGETVETQWLELASGEEADVEFEIPADEIGIGVVRYGVTTGNEVERANLTVEGDEPAAYEITSFEPGNVTVEEEGFFNVTAEITNTGERTANQTVSLQIDDDERTSARIELPPGESRTFRVFNIYVGALDPGEYEYGVVTDADEELATLEIE